MHAEAFEWTRNAFNEWKKNRIGNVKVLEFGSLDINGGVRGIFNDYSDLYVGVDMQDGPGVDIVGDAKSFSYPSKFDVIVACEVFEHTPDWREIIDNSYSLLNNGGVFIATMAGEGRFAHSAIDENPIRDWEYYDNVGAWELNRHLKSIFQEVKVNTLGSDLRCMAVKASF